jgi:hypothetical protein
MSILSIGIAIHFFDLTTLVSQRYAVAGARRSIGGLQPQLKPGFVAVQQPGSNSYSLCKTSWHHHTTIPLMWKISHKNSERKCN